MSVYSSKREREVNPDILARRQKQIDYGKNTTGYQRYVQLIPKSVITLSRYSNSLLKYVLYEIIFILDINEAKSSIIREHHRKI